MNYRRMYILGGTYFFTVVAYKRRPIFSSLEAVKLLRNAFSYTMLRMPFTIIADVILPDHMHFIWTMPTECSDYSARWRTIKSHFTRNWRLREYGNKSSSQPQDAKIEVWQKRFWEHSIRDETDLLRHVEYIHYNPVKHGLASSPLEWKYSSFKKFVNDGLYTQTWGGSDICLDKEKWME
jgi:putative transposase